LQISPKLVRKARRREGSKIGDRAIGNEAEDLIRGCQSALNDPQTDKARLQELIAQCSTKLTQLVEERRSLLDAARTRIEDIAALVASQTAVWPEEIARLEALSREIQSRAASLKEN
jgi:hypothetical protein